MNPWIVATVAAAIPTALMIVFGVLCLRTEAELHRLEEARDNNWDARHGIKHG